MSLDPSDLLDEDGNVDAGAVRSRQQEGITRSPEIDPETCSAWRRAAKGETNVEHIADGTEYRQNTISKHVSGRCCCEADAPPLRYDAEYGDGHGRRGEWVLDG